jgi:uncharacterized protein (DUF885 family)
MSARARIPGNWDARQRLRLWDDHSDAHTIELNAQAEADLQRPAQRIQLDALGESAQLSYRIFEYNQQRRCRSSRHHSYAVSQMNNIASDIPTFLQNLHKVETAQDARDYISRLQGVEAVMQQYVELLRQREALGVIPPKMVYDRALPAARSMLQGAPFEEAVADGVVLADFRTKVDALHINDDDKAILLNDAANAPQRPIPCGLPDAGAELERLQALAQQRRGMGLPDGAEYYANRVGFATTVDKSPEEIHQLGLDEVARIRAEMVQIQRRF